MNCEALKQSRQDVNMSVSEAARAVGCSRAHLWELENGEKNCRPSAELLFDLSELYGVSFSWLIGKSNRDGSPVIEAPSPALDEMAQFYGLSEADKMGLAQQSYRGKKPQTALDYWFIWHAVGLCC